MRHNYDGYNSYQVLFCKNSKKYILDEDDENKDDNNIEFEILNINSDKIDKELKEYN